MPGAVGQVQIGKDNVDAIVDPGFLNVLMALPRRMKG